MKALIGLIAYNKFLRLFLIGFLLTTLYSASTAEPSAATKGPIVPRWVFEPWIWDDNIADNAYKGHCQEEVMRLVAGYRSRAIPAGVIIIDSPWATNFNTFVFEPSAFPRPQEMIDSLHQQGMKVILWATDIINHHSDSTYFADWFRGGKAQNFDEAFRQGFFISKGEIVPWWWGYGCFVDHTNPSAAKWWGTQMQKAMALGIDGWKVDASTRKFPKNATCYLGTIAKDDFSYYYYKNFYDATMQYTNGKGIIYTRPFDEVRSDSTYVPPQYSHAAWVGDQRHTWSDAGYGLENALNNILLAARRGFIAVGSNIGGFTAYNSGKNQLINRQLFIRWTQLGALSPIMENGGYDQHRPWEYDQEVLDIYSYYANLHHALVPYLYSEGYKCHKLGGSIIKIMDNAIKEYKLGENIFFAPVYTVLNKRDIHLPKGADWIDFWDASKVYVADKTYNWADANLKKCPLYIRRGAIIPLHIDNSILGLGSEYSADYLTLLIYPTTSSTYIFYDDAGVPTQVTCKTITAGLRISITPSQEKFIIKTRLKTAFSAVMMNNRILPSVESFFDLQRTENGWFRDADSNFWIKLQKQDSSITIETTAAVPVEWGEFHGQVKEDAVELFWSTHSESANLGFSLERRSSCGANWSEVAFIVGNGTTQDYHGYRFFDRPIDRGILEYRLKQVDRDGSCSYSQVISVFIPPPQQFELGMSYPNPFSRQIKGIFSLHETARVRLRVVNCLGQTVYELLDRSFQAGRYDYAWDGCDRRGLEMPDGVYFLVFQISGNKPLAHKIIKMRQ